MTNEPTTGEIVRALRCDGDANNCVDCRYATYETATILCDQEQNVRDSADRLESQEREIEELKSEAIVNALDNAERIAELTARAESAERERDAVIRDLKAYPNCFTCKHDAKPEDESPCSECWGMGIDMAYEWCGLQPQDGERK